MTDENPPDSVPSPEHGSVQGSAALDAQEGNMTTATIEVDDDAAEGHPRRVALFTIAVLLPADLNDADIEDIVPTAIKVEGCEPSWVLTDFIETKVREARLVMT